jgi:hypothetical protein
MTIPLSMKTRCSLGVVAVALYFVAWLLAEVNVVYGSSLQVFTSCGLALFNVRWHVVAGACVYSVVRRFASKKHRWDLYGPLLALLSAVLIEWETLRYV